MFNFTLFFIFVALAGILYLCGIFMKIMNCEKFYVNQQGNREQLAISEFAQALLVIPKTLAFNGAFDAIELVSQLCAYHHAAQNHSKEDVNGDYKYTGIKTVLL